MRSNEYINNRLSITLQYFNDVLLTWRMDRPQIHESHFETLSWNSNGRLF